MTGLRGKAIMTMIMRYALLTIIRYGLKIRMLTWNSAWLKNRHFIRLHGTGRNRKTLCWQSAPKGSLDAIDKNTVEGYDLYSNKVKVYFYIKTDRIFSSDPDLNTSSEVKRPTLAMIFDVAEKEKVGIKMGVSFVDAEQARKNLEMDIPDWNFESLKARGRDIWNNELGR